MLVLFCNDANAVRKDNLQHPSCPLGTHGCAVFLLFFSRKNAGNARFLPSYRYYARAATFFPGGRKGRGGNKGFLRRRFPRAPPFSPPSFLPLRLRTLLWRRAARLNRRRRRRGENAIPPLSIVACFASQGLGWEEKGGKREGRLEHHEKEKMAFADRRKEKA